MSRYRAHLLQSVSDLGLSLYGDSEWLSFKELLNSKIRFCGPIDYEKQPIVYNASKINLNITRRHIKGVHRRVYDILSCEAFCLTDYREDLESQFEIGKEVVVYRDKKELRDLVEYFLKHPKERQEIAKRGQKRVLEEHTYERRMERLIEIMRETFGIKDKV